VGRATRNDGRFREAHEVGANMPSYSVKCTDCNGSYEQRANKTPEICGVCGSSNICVESLFELEGETANMMELAQAKQGELRCPTCGCGEIHPATKMLLIRGFKIHSNGHWWSQCLVCCGYYDQDLNLTPNAETNYRNNIDGMANKGWF
jgi:hypothetical protein